MAQPLSNHPVALVGQVNSMLIEFHLKQTDCARVEPEPGRPASQTETLTIRQFPQFPINCRYLFVIMKQKYSID